MAQEYYYDEIGKILSRCGGSCVKRETEHALTYAFVWNNA